jgi:hypothetical protein
LLNLGLTIFVSTDQKSACTHSRLGSIFIAVITTGCFHYQAVVSWQLKIENKPFTGKRSLFLTEDSLHLQAKNDFGKRFT